MRVLLLLLAISVAQAADVPQGSSLDTRIQYSEYRPGEVYQITASVGVATWVVLAPDEKILIVDPGFDGWILTPTDNVLSIKPTAVNGVEPTKQWRTNINLLTSKGRHYALDVMLVDRNDTLARIAYTVHLRYTDEQVALAQAEQAQAQSRTAPARPIHCTNMSYGLEPGKSWQRIAPDRVCDDGDRMYVSFAPGKSLPTFFRVDEDCMPSRTQSCETQVTPVADPARPGTFMIRPLSRLLMLRSDPSVILITNTHYQPTRDTP